MPEAQNNEGTGKDQRDSPVSALFVAMMRQAAAAAAYRGNSAKDSETETGAVDEAGPAISLEPRDEPHRIQRIRPRLRLRRPPPASLAGGFLGTIFVSLVSTALVATLLMFFVDPEFLNPAVVEGLQLDQEQLIAGISAPRPTPVQTPQWLKRIGIISGHRGRDSGAVCEDEFGYPELKEVDINFAVSQRVVAQLKAANYAVDLLDENDPRLENYRAAAVLSIHANTCFDFGEYVSGYIVHKSDARPDFGIDAFLRECVALNYGAIVPLPRSYVETDDLINYHAFNKIHPLTPAVILEMGYMLADRAVLTEDQDLLAAAILAGLHCFIENADGSSIQPPGARGPAGYLVPIVATETPEFRR